MNRPFPYAEAVVLVANTEKPIVLKGPTHTGLQFVRWLCLSHDEGKIAGATIQDVTAKVVPQQGHTDKMGGAIAHPFYAQPSQFGSLRHQLFLGFDLPPGVDIDVTLLSVAGGTIRLVAHRFLVFDRGGPMPQLIAPGGFPILNS